MVDKPVTKSVAPKARACQTGQAGCGKARSWLRRSPLRLRRKSLLRQSRCSASRSKPRLLRSPRLRRFTAPVIETAAAVVTAPVAEQLAPVAIETKPVETSPAAPVIAAPKEGKTLMNDTINQAQEAAKNFTAQATDKAQAAFGDMNVRAKDAMAKGTKAIEELVEFSKGNLEAMVASGRVAANGVQEIAKYSAEYGRKSIEEANATAKRFRRCQVADRILPAPVGSRQVVARRAGRRGFEVHRELSEAPRRDRPADPEPRFGRGRKVKTTVAA